MCKTVNSGAKTSLFRKCSTCVDAESCSEHVAVASTVAALRTVEQLIELWRLVRHAGGTFGVHSESDDRRTSVARRRVSVQFLIAAARFHPVLELHNCVSFYIPSKLAVNWLLIMTDIQNIPIVEVRGWWFTVSFFEVTLNTDVFSAFLH